MTIVLPNSRTAMTPIFGGAQTSVALIRFDVLCHATCKTCGLELQDPNDCISCSDGYFLVGGNQCLPCSPQCGTCVNTLDKCTSCPSGSNFLGLNPLSYQCVCPDGQYGSSDSCLECASPCESCISANTCLSCREPFVYDPITNKCGCPGLSVEESGTCVCKKSCGYFWVDEDCKSCGCGGSSTSVGECV